MVFKIVSWLALPIRFFIKLMRSVCRIQICIIKRFVSNNRLSFILPFFRTRLRLSFKMPDLKYQADVRQSSNSWQGIIWKSSSIYFENYGIESLFILALFFYLGKYCLKMFAIWPMGMGRNSLWSGIWVFIFYTSHFRVIIVVIIISKTEM